ncbi:DUF1648 domain-containing protein [Actinotalea sp. C106]|uniref:DUF1648 domain-containing protein n=1 Tax=Actinotalea sp. C106 TaxID=2908644 RepID=UPI00202967D1|nr:DUF1648 domain-containing protein [Actinotalea sp. C106]
MAVALGAPILVTAAFLTVAAVWSEGLGDPIATHWDWSGEPDGYGSRTSFAVVVAVMTIVLGVALGIAAGFARTWVMMRRGLLGLGIGTSVYLGGLGVVSLAVQRDGTAGRLTLWSMLALGVLAVLAGALASRVPRDRQPVVLAVDPPDPALPRSQVRGVPAHPIGGGARLSVDEDLVRVRWYLGDALRLHVAEVAGAEAITVSAFGEFGGWGLRMSPLGGRYAFLGRGSQAVELTKADGTRWVITTPQAEEVAGVINAAADRQRRARPTGAVAAPMRTGDDAGHPPETTI